MLGVVCVVGVVCIVGVVFVMGAVCIVGVEPEPCTWRWGTPALNHSSCLFNFVFGVCVCVPAGTHICTRRREFKSVTC